MTDRVLDDVPYMHRWLESALRAVVRVCVRQSVRLGDFVEILKAVYVSVAEEELRSGGEQGSASRVSAMTGVHRKDIARFKAASGKPKPKQDLISKVMVQWQHDERFTTKGGKPRVLECEGRHSEFAELVEAVNGGDVGAYAVLFEMERSGIVTRTGGRVKLLWRDYAPEVGLREGLEMIVDDVDDLYRAVEENIDRLHRVPNLHLRTDFDKIVASAVPEIRRWLLEQGSVFHKKVRGYLSKFDADLRPELDSGTERFVSVTLGSFSRVSDTFSTQHQEKA